MKDEEILDLIPNPIGLEVVVADVASQRSLPPLPIYMIDVYIIKIHLFRYF